MIKSNLWSSLLVVYSDKRIGRGRGRQILCSRKRSRPEADLPLDGDSVGTWTRLHSLHSLNFTHFYFFLEFYPRFYSLSLKDRIKEKGLTVRGTRVFHPLRYQGIWSDSQVKGISWGKDKKESCCFIPFPPSHCLLVLLLCNFLLYVLRVTHIQRPSSDVSYWHQNSWETIFFLSLSLFHWHTQWMSCFYRQFYSINNLCFFTLFFNVNFCVGLREKKGDGF